MRIFYIYIKHVFNHTRTRGNADHKALLMISEKDHYAETLQENRIESYVQCTQVTLLTFLLQEMSGLVYIIGHVSPQTALDSSCIYDKKTKIA